MKRSNTPSKLSPQRGARIALLPFGLLRGCTLTVTGLLPRPLFDALFLCGLLALSARCIRVVLPRMTPRQREWLYVWVYVPLFCFFLPGSALWRDTEAGLGERIRTPAYVAVAFLFIAAHIFYFLYKTKPKMRKKIVAGNWKMNTLPAEGAELARASSHRRDGAGRGEFHRSPAVHPPVAGRRGAQGLEHAPRRPELRRAEGAPTRAKCRRR